MLNGVRYSHKRVIKYKDNSLVQAAAAATAAIGPDGTATTANTTAAAAAAAAASVGNGNRVCIVCRKATAPYLCPKCNTPYCCVKCYESHGPRCTEAFYKGHVKREQELRAAAAEAYGEDVHDGVVVVDGADEPPANELIERLRQRQRAAVAGTGGDRGSGSPQHSTDAHTDADADADADADGSTLAEPSPADCLSAERVEQLLENMDDLSLDDLSPDERRHFMRAVAAGTLSAQVKPWTPWWHLKDATLIVATPDAIVPLEVSASGRTTANTPPPPPLSSAAEDDGDEGRAAEAHPADEAERALRQLARQAKALPGFETVSLRPASEHMRYMVVDILFAHCCVLRSFNGAWATDPPDAAAKLVATSSVLATDARHTAVGTVLEAGCIAVTAADFGRQSTLAALSFFEDAAHVMSVRAMAVCVLLDAYHLLRGEAAAAPPSPASSGTRRAAGASKPGVVFGPPNSPTAPTQMAATTAKVAQKREGKSPKSPKSRNKSRDKRRELLAKKLWFYVTWARSADDGVFKEAHGALSKAIQVARDYHAAAAGDSAAAEGVGGGGEAERPTNRGLRPEGQTPLIVELDGTGTGRGRP